MYTSKKLRFIPVEPVFRRDTGPRIASLDLSKVPIVTNQKQKYEGEMAEREVRAQKEIEMKKKCVAPLHKSNYVYVTEGMNPAGFGRKNEVL